jgi:alpha-galactosidase
MPQGLKIVLIGAGSREFARGLIHDLVLERPLWETRDLSVVMVDVNAEQLELMRSYAERCVAVAGARIRISATTDRREALRSADFVLISVATKRMELWEQDFRVPFAFGIRHIYGENGGPGAAFHALRNMRTILPMCADIEELCPDAWVLSFTNPEARILTAILTLTRVRAIGLCHGFYSFRKLARAVLDRPFEELDIRTAGINHFYTHYRIAERDGGRDLTPEFEARLAAHAEELPPLVRYLWRTFGAIGYVSDHHIGEYLGFAHEITGLLWPFGVERRLVAPDEQGVDTRTVFEAWRRSIDVAAYLRGDYAGREHDELSGTIPLRREDIKASGELAVPVIADMALDRRQLREAVNVLNTGGYIENLDRDTSVELPAVIDAEGVHPETVGRLPEGFASLIRQQQAVQRLLVQAYRERSRKLLLQCLLIDPAVGGHAAQVERMLDHMLAIQKEYLPELG